MLMPAFSKAIRADAAGIEAIRSGWPEAIAQPIKVASGRLSSRCASFLDIRTNAEAPVLRPGALPAVTVGLP